MYVYIILDTEAPVLEAIKAVLELSTVGSMDPIEFYVTKHLGKSNYNPVDYTDLDYVTEKTY